MKRQIQTTGSWNEENGYSFCVCFDDNIAMTLDGLTEEDIYSIASCSLALLPEDRHQSLLNF